MGIDETHFRNMALCLIQCFWGYGSDWDDKNLNNLTCLLYELTFSVVYKFDSQMEDQKATNRRMGADCIFRSDRALFPCGRSEEAIQKVF